MARLSVSSYRKQTNEGVTIQGTLQLITNETSQCQNSSSPVQMKFKLARYNKPILYSNNDLVINVKPAAASSPSHSNDLTKEIWLGNNFLSDLHFTRIHSSNNNFQVHEQMSSFNLKMQEKKQIFQIRYSYMRNQFRQPDLAKITLEINNAVSIYLTLMAYDESLLCEKIEEGQAGSPQVCASSLEKSQHLHNQVIDFKQISVNEVRHQKIKLININPTEIKLISYTVSNKLIKVTFEQIVGGSKFVSELSNNKLQDQASNNQSLINICIDCELLISFTLQTAGQQAANQTCNIIFTTSSGTFPIHIKFNIVVGQLIFIPEQLKFTNIFPGVIQNITLQIYSTFQSPVELIQITSHDPCF